MAKKKEIVEEAVVEEVKKETATAKKNTKKTKTNKTEVEVTTNEESKDVEIDEIKEDKSLSVETNHKKRSTVLIAFISLLMVLGIGFSLYFMIFNNENVSKPSEPNNKLPKLPKPEVTEGERGQLGIDKNINEKTIDKYLNREDAVYRDMRMLEDPASYEEIGGDRFLSGYINGFEVVSLPYIIPVNNLPEEVGTTYSGSTLFFQMSDGSYVPMYEESMDIIEELFPKNKVIFLMCGGGGYAGMMKEFLVSQGWNKDKIYVVGGYWYYKGKNSVDVPKKTNKYGYTYYDFDDVPYHDIDFTELTEIVPDRHNKGEIKPFDIEEDYYNGGKDEVFDKLLEKLDKAYDTYNETHKTYDYDEYEKYYQGIQQEIADYINKLLKDKKSFLVAVYNDYGCGDDDDTIRTKALEYTEKKKIYVYDIGVDALYKSDLYKDVRNTPNFIMIKKGKVYTFYYDESDDDLKITESKEATAKWIEKYINIK